MGLGPVAPLTAQHATRNTTPMFALLVKVRILGMWNSARHSTGRSRLVTAGLTLLSGLIFGTVYYGFERFLGLAQDRRALRIGPASR